MLQIAVFKIFLNKKTINIKHHKRSLTKEMNLTLNAVGISDHYYLKTIGYNFNEQQREMSVSNFNYILNEVSHQFQVNHS
jgi:hypothetical protein